jgi:DNA modification methylase
LNHVVTGEGWTLYRGDCFEILPTLGQVDHVFADTPYEVEAHTKARRALKDATQKKGAANTGEVRRIDQPLVISFGAITEEQRAEFGVQFARLARRWVLAFAQIEAVGAWRTSLVAGGLDWVRGGIWRKPNGAPQFTGDRPGQGFESICIAHQPGKKRWNAGGKHAVWTFPLEHGAGNGERHDHPTQKPEALLAALVADFTDVGETILDPTCGSGTTGAAALKAGRRFVGIERDPTFFDLSVERLRAAETGNTVRAQRAGQTTLTFGNPE